MAAAVSSTSSSSSPSSPTTTPTRNFNPSLSLPPLPAPAPATVPAPQLPPRPWRYPEQVLGPEAMSPQQRQQQAVDWGYDQVGVVLPEEVSVRAVAEAVLFSCSSSEEEAPAPASSSSEGTDRPQQQNQPKQNHQPKQNQQDQQPPAASTGTTTTTTTTTVIDPRTPAPIATALRSALSCAVIAAAYAWMWHMRTLLPWWQASLCWLAIGTAYFGLFQGVGGDAARGALLPLRPRLRDALGALVMAPALWSFESWKARWWAFVRRPALLVDSADDWQVGAAARSAAQTPFALAPLTLNRLETFHPVHRQLHRALRATPLRFFYPSLVAWFRSWDALNLRRWDAAARLAALRGWLAPMAFVALAWPSMTSFGAAVAASDSALVGLCVSWLMPWLAFHGWTSLLALAQRTGPHAIWARRPVSAHHAAQGGAYDYMRALVSASATLSLPRWLEVLIHDANYHLPASISASCCLLGTGPAPEHPYGVCAVPSPRLRDAHVQLLRPKLGPYLTEGVLLRPALLLNLMTGWMVYDEHGKGTYIDWDEAVGELMARRRRRGQGEQQQVQGA
jgi:hypothetical protein